MEALDLREKLIARFAIFEGMRPDEILALRWKSIEGTAIYVEERCTRRKPNTPKNGSKRERCDLRRNTHAVTRVGRSGSRLGLPIGEDLVSLDNVWRRSIQPRLEKIGLSWASFQVLRRINASLSKKAGVDPKIASDQRGHGIGVSLDVYASSDLEQKRDARSKLEAVVLRKAQPESQLAVGELGLTA